MKRGVALAQAAMVVVAAALWTAPVQAVTVSGGVEGAYEYYDVNQAAADDALARLRQTYLLNVAGDVWAPEVASYRSGLRYDVVTQSWEWPGGTLSDGVRSLNLEARVFPFSPLNLTVGANVRSSRDDALDVLGVATALDELGVYGRFWLGLSGLPATTVQASHNTSTGSRTEGRVERTTQNVTADNLSVSSVIRRPRAQTQVNLQAGRNLDQLFDSQTVSRAASVQFTGVPSAKWQVRASAELSGVDTYKPTTTLRAQRQSLAARAMYQVRMDENLQVAVSGSRDQQALPSGDLEDFATLVTAQYTRPLRPGLRSAFSADVSRVTGRTPSDPNLTTIRGLASLRAELSSSTAQKTSWLSALSVEQQETPASTKPGATVEGRLDYRWRPSVTVGAGAFVYRDFTPESAAATDDTGRVGIQSSLRWAGGRTGRASLNVSATTRQYPGTTGQENKVALSTGVSPRGDLDLSADLQFGRSEVPIIAGSWMATGSFTGAAVFRPRPDLTVTLNLSRQQSETVSGAREQTVGTLKGEYLFYALRLGGSLKLTQLQDVVGGPQRSLEAILSVRRDF